MATYADQLAACDAEIAKFTAEKSAAGRTRRGHTLTELLNLKKYLEAMVVRESRGGRLAVTLAKVDTTS